MKSYRKTTIASLPELNYLDDRPVFPDERRACEAYARGGLEAERAERKKIKEEERAQHRKQMDSFQRMCEEARAAGREKRAMREEDKYTDETDPVETWERRSRRLQERWEVENKENIQDDARKRAEEVLKNEKEQNTGLYDPNLQKAYADEKELIPSSKEQ